MKEFKEVGGGSSKVPNGLGIDLKWFLCEDSKEFKEAGGGSSKVPKGLRIDLKWFLCGLHLIIV